VGGVEGGEPGEEVAECGSSGFGYIVGGCGDRGWG
jgi:hypothetical protein